MSDRNHRAPRWVVVSAIIAAILLLAFVFLFIFGGGRHGPGQHGFGQHDMGAAVTVSGSA